MSHLSESKQSHEIIRIIKLLIILFSSPPSRATIDVSLTRLLVFMMDLLYEFCQELLEATDSPARSQSPSIEVASCERKVRFASDNPTIDESASPIEQLLTFASNWDDACQILWYSEEELQEFKAESRQILLNKHKMSPTELRGLERYDYERSKYKKRTLQNILLAYYDILTSFSSSNNDSGGEKNYEAGNQENVEEAFRQVCRQQTAWARRTAYDQGKRDESVVRRWQQEEREQAALKLNIKRQGLWGINNPRCKTSASRDRIYAGRNPFFGNKKRKR